MDDVAKLRPAQRRELFFETGSRMGIEESLVEKDFWVCWTLKRLFELPETKDHLLFKGGTTLSKVFGLIDRFSEDIDLTVDRKFLGFADDKAPENQSSAKQRAMRLKEMRAACDSYIANDLLAALNASFQHALSDEEAWSLAVEPTNPEQIIFTYPQTTQGAEYVQQSVCLEIGIRGEFEPNDWYQVEPYAAQHLPVPFAEPKVRVRAMQAARTFWEKATILHQEHHRDSERKAPDRFARHYYASMKWPWCNPETHQNNQ